MLPIDKNNIKTIILPENQLRNCLLEFFLNAKI